MREGFVVIKNTLGIHARPATAFVRLASKYKSKVEVIKDGYVADGKSILDILALGAERGSKILLRVEGEDEDEAFKALKDLLEHGIRE